MPQHIAIVGAGYALPPHIRTNNDPIFDWLRNHGYPPDAAGPFTGFVERRVLAPPGTMAHLPTCVTDLMVAAAQQALSEARLKAAQVDLLVGWASISEIHHSERPDDSAQGIEAPAGRLAGSSGGAGEFHHRFVDGGCPHQGPAGQDRSHCCRLQLEPVCGLPHAAKRQCR